MNNPQNSKASRLPNTLSILSLIVSVTAFLTSLHDQNQTRANQTAILKLNKQSQELSKKSQVAEQFIRDISIRPNLTFETNATSQYKVVSGNKFGIYLEIINKGQGTAKVHSTNYFYDNEPKELIEIQNILDSPLNEKLDYNVLVKSKSLKASDKNGYPINPQEKIAIVAEMDGYNGSKHSAKELSRQDLKLAQKDLENKWNKIGVIYCYSSHYNNGYQFVYSDSELLKSLKYPEPNSFCKELHKGLNLEFPDDN
ncbi:MAG: hypothetical protein ACRC1Z_12985 [Waterburya sp.]